MDLTTGLAMLSDNGTLYLADGIYQYNAVNFGASGKRVVVHALAGARPVITGADGNPPNITIGAGSKVYDIWMGGTKFADGGSRFVYLYDNATMEGCTIWGYGQCSGGGGTNHRIYKQNRFVNCGFGTLYHDIYISAAIVTDDQILENIHIGGGGYKIQLYHDPEYVIVHANFMASNSECSDLAIQQYNHTITNNILWGPVDVSYWNAETCTFSKNIIGADRAAFTDMSANNTVDGNVFCNGQTAFGTNPATWDAAAIASNLGKTKAEIDTAISNLITKFGQTTAQIYADATIEADFAVLKAVIDAWKNA